MITDVPTGDDFQQSGVAFLNLAWDNAIELIFILNNSGMSDLDYWGDEQRDFWKAAQKPLATSLALAQQGIELLLKGRIAAISPFLLVSGSPRDWPRGCDKNDVPFADFRTIDAQDLVRAHDTVASQRLPDDFKTRFNRLRSLRNSIFHSVDKRLELTAADVLFVIMEASDILVGKHQWLALRRQHLESNHNAAVFSDDYSVPQMAGELMAIVDICAPADLFRLIGFNKRQRRYLCLSCSRATDTLMTLAHLRPNTPQSTNLVCFACGQVTAVVRRGCTVANCKGNVIDAEDDVCCTCNHSQDEVGSHDEQPLPARLVEPPGAA